MTDEEKLKLVEANVQLKAAISVLFSFQESRRRERDMIPADVLALLGRAQALTEFLASSPVTPPAPKRYVSMAKK